MTIANSYPEKLISQGNIKDDKEKDKEVKKASPEEMSNFIKTHLNGPSGCKIKVHHLWDSFFRVNFHKIVNSNNEIVYSRFLKVLQDGDKLILDVKKEKSRWKVNPKGQGIDC